MSRAYACVFESFPKTVAKFWQKNDGISLHGTPVEAKRHGVSDPRIPPLALFSLGSADPEFRFTLAHCARAFLSRSSPSPSSQSSFDSSSDSTPESSRSRSDEPATATAHTRGAFKALVCRPEVHDGFAFCTYPDAADNEYYGAHVSRLQVTSLSRERSFLPAPTYTPLDAADAPKRVEAKTGKGTKTTATLPSWARREGGVQTGLEWGYERCSVQDGIALGPRRGWRGRGPQTHLMDDDEDSPLPQGWGRSLVLSAIAGGGELTVADARAADEDGRACVPPSARLPPNADLLRRLTPRCGYPRLGHIPQSIAITSTAAQGRPTPQYTRARGTGLSLVVVDAVGSAVHVRVDARAPATKSFSSSVPLALERVPKVSQREPETHAAIHEQRQRPARPAALVVKSGWGLRVSLSGGSSAGWSYASSGISARSMASLPLPSQDPHTTQRAAPSLASGHSLTVCSAV
ncbi:hypothetical protein K438DRAFT_1952422 [Mycena galopus ATCC 62051]|nr:hypothetical protein K438DRAFT_1952422 [Mycena galopus ATCC 62051]